MLCLQLWNTASDYSLFKTNCFTSSYMEAGEILAEGRRRKLKKSREHKSFHCKVTGKEHSVPSWKRYAFLLRWNLRCLSSLGNTYPAFSSVRHSKNNVRSFILSGNKYPSLKMITTSPEVLLWWAADTLIDSLCCKISSLNWPYLHS